MQSFLSVWLRRAPPQPATLGASTGAVEYQANRGSSWPREGRFIGG
jgi:hypothetical protein